MSTLIFVSLAFLINFYIPDITESKKSMETGN